MNKCNHFKQKLYLYYYNELSEQENKRMKKHLTQCKNCAGQYQKLRAILYLLSQKTLFEKISELVNGLSIQ